MLRTESGLKYFTLGDGPEAVILHPSLGLGRFLFYRLVVSLSRRYMVFCYDPRGVGDNRAMPPGMQGWVDDVGQLMAIAGRPAHLVGVSLGTWVMSRAAVRWPERTRRVILMGATVGFANGLAQVEARRQALSETSMEEFARTYADQTLTEFCDPEVKEQLIEDLKTGDPAAYLESMQVIYSVDNQDVFSAMQAPTLVIVGARDTRTSPAMADQVAELIPESTVRVVFNAGHLALLDQPMRVQQLVETFLAAGEIDD